MPKQNNVIEYKFEGNILDLEQAITMVSKRLTEAAKRYKQFQDGILTEDQKAELERLRAHRNALLRFSKTLDMNNSDQRRRAKASGDYLLKQTLKYEKESYQVKKRYRDKQYKEQEALAKKQKALEEQRTEALSPSGRLKAQVESEYLTSSANQLTDFLSEDALNEITSAVANYQQAMQDTTLSTEDQADATIQLNDVYDKYISTLKLIRHNVELNGKSLTSFNDLMNQAIDRIKLATQSINFYIRILKKLFTLSREGIQTFADYVESVNFLDIAAKNLSKDMISFTNKQALSFGLDPTTVNQTTASFYALVQSLNMTGKTSVLISQNLTKLAEDMSALYNVELDIMSNKLRSALAGRTQAMQQLGIVVSDTSVNEWLLSKNIRVQMREMNEASQAAARYAFILESTRTAQGALAKEIKTPANQLRIFRTQLEELKKYLGAFISQVGMPILRLLNFILQPINGLLKGITDIANSGFTNSVADMSDSLEDLGEAADTAAVGLTGLDEINQDSGGSKSIYGKLNEDIEALLQSYDNQADKLGNLAKLFYDIGQLIGHIFSLFTGTSFFTYVAEGLDMIVGKLKDLTSWIEGVKDWLDRAPKWLKVIGSILQTILSTFSGLASYILVAAAAMSVWNKLMASDIAKNFVSILKSMVDGFKQAIKAIAAKIAALKAHKKATDENTISQAANVVADKQQQVSTMAATVAENVKTTATRGNTTATQQNTGATASNTAGNIANASSGVAAGGGQVAASGPAALITAGLILSGLAMIAGIAAMIKGFSAMATGGVVDRPTFALIGEGKYNEAVVPLGQSPQFTEMKQDIAQQVLSALGSRSTGTNQPIILNINGRELARAILPDIEVVQPQTGMRLRRA